MLDFDEIKRRIDLLDYIQRDLGQAGRRSGGNVFFRCPFHDERTGSFAVNTKGNFWKCFGCGEGGSVIDFVMRRQGLDFKGALEFLGAHDVPAMPQARQRRRPEDDVKRRELSPPGATWQGDIARIIEHCEKTMWTPEGARAREYLRGRGLNDDTLKRYRLGYQARDAELFNRYVARGIVVPWFQGATVWRLKIRRQGNADPKYTQIARNDDGAQGAPLFGVNHLRGKKTAIVCEGEFDAMLLDQVAGDLVAVVTFGSATDNKQESIDAWISYLLDKKRIFIATDRDGPGDDAANRWKAATQRAVRVLPPLRDTGKDITDAWKQGADLRAWVRGLLTEKQ